MTVSELWAAIAEAITLEHVVPIAIIGGINVMCAAWGWRHRNDCIGIPEPRWWE